MTTKFFHSLRTAAVLTVAGIAASGSAVAAEARLSALSFIPNHTAFGKPFADWVEKINGEAKGTVQIEIKASGSMSPFTMGNAVKSGVVDMVHLPHTFYQNLLPIGDAMKLNQKTPQELRENGTVAFLNELHNDKVNAEYLGHWGLNIPFHIYLRNKKIAGPDLSGLKLRITPVYRAFFRAMGAELIQIPPADVYTALERGTVDGLGWPQWDIKSFGWDKQIKYRVDPGFYGTSEAFLINLDKWKTLDSAQQAYLKKSFQDMEDEMWEKAKELNKSYAKEQADAGVETITLSDEDVTKYRRMSYEAGWEEVLKLDPVNGPKMKELISGTY
ncbi:MAG: TRAP transporter substrate-binding protein DctP [Rhodospirillaceae bacterium]